MQRIFYVQLLIFILLAGLASGAGRTGQCLADKKVPQASLNGKYINLLHVIPVPEDKDEWGEFCEWGYWTGTEYGNFTDLKPGFWVYVYPKWYVWEKLAAEEKVGSNANVQGKYRVLLHVLEVPEDADEFGAFRDWGFAETYSYEGYENLTPGYWVYVKPNWYVWADIKETCSSGT